jgi:hypothetical protein
MLPFSPTQFFELFARYNIEIWPAQIFAYLLAVAALGLIAIRRDFRLAFLILGVFWLWNGLVYHFVYFATINKAAYGFAALFVAQGIGFVASATRRRNPARSLGWNVPTVLGAIVIFYGAVGYSLAGLAVGHGWPLSPMLGVAPCPTTIFTIGILMLGVGSVPLSLCVVPVLWALVGSTAAVLLGVIEDLGLLAAAVALLMSALVRRQATG